MLNHAVLATAARIRTKWEDRGLFRHYQPGTKVCAYHHQPALVAECPKCKTELWLYKKFRTFGWVWIHGMGGKEIQHEIDAATFLRGSDEALQDAMEHGPQSCPKCGARLPQRLEDL